MFINVQIYAKKNHNKDKLWDHRRQVMVKKSKTKHRKRGGEIVER